jgi:hypothetical protein
MSLRLKIEDSREGLVAIISQRNNDGKITGRPSIFLVGDKEEAKTKSEGSGARLGVEHLWCRRQDFQSYAVTSSPHQIDGGDVNSPRDQAVILEELRTTTRDGGESDGRDDRRRARAIKYDLIANLPKSRSYADPTGLRIGLRVPTADAHAANGERPRHPRPGPSGAGLPRYQPVDPDPWIPRRFW